MGSYLTSGASLSNQAGVTGLSSVQGVCIDQSVKISGKLDLVKIDAEGGEVEVLTGMARTIEVNRPFVLFECVDKQICEPVTRFFFERGYKLFEIDDINGKVVGTERLVVHTQGDGKPDMSRLNRVAVHETNLGTLSAELDFLHFELSL